MNILILAGGSGTRLWPASRKAKPKQLLPFIGGKTLLQNTYERFLKFAKPGNIYIGTLTEYAPAVRRQAPKVPLSNYSLEPTLRDRGPAIGLAALLMYHHSPKSSFVTAWSDHYISPEKNYLDMLKRAEKYLDRHPETVLAVGVKPSFAHTGMGYIERDGKISATGLKLSKVTAFKEKPDRKTAERYGKSKKYLWNTGYFIWKTATLLELYRRHLPEIYKLLMQIQPAIGTQRQQAVINKVYPRMPKTDIEKGLIEKIRNRAVITADFTWADIGSWRTIKEVLSQPGSNLIKGQWAGVDTDDTLVYNYTDKLVTTAGLRNCIIVATDEVVLVADKNNSVEIKKLILALEQNPKLRKYL